MGRYEHRGEYKLSAQELKFVAAYLETGNLVQAVRLAGYNTTSPSYYGRKLLAKDKIQAELKDELKLMRNQYVASNSEILEFYTMAMRGEIKDQFGLDATLQDRIRAAEALARRTIDVEQMLEKAKDQEIKVNVSFGDNVSSDEESTE